jgi:PST family polysaccharide transporter
VLIVSLVLGPAAAGPFALANRLYGAIRDILGPIISAVYPFVCRIAIGEETPQDARTKRIFFRVIVCTSAVLSIATFCFAPLIIRLVGGSAFQDAAPVLRLMAFLPFLIALSNIFGIQTMIPLRMDRELSWVVTSAAAIGVPGMFAFTNLWGLQGACYTMLLVESFVTVTMAFILERRMNVLSLFLQPR